MSRLTNTGLPTQSTIDRNILICNVRINALHKLAPADWMIALLEMQKRRNILVSEIMSSRNV